MDDNDKENPFESPGTEPSPVHRSVTGADIAKVIVSIMLAIVIIPCVPFGIIGKVIYMIGVSFAIYNFALKLIANRNVHGCPNCGRELSIDSQICPRCETRLF